MSSFFPLTWSEVTYLNKIGTFFKILSATLEEVLRHQLLGINFRAGGTKGARGQFPPSPILAEIKAGPVSSKNIVNITDCLTSYLSVLEF